MAKIRSGQRAGDQGAKGKVTVPSWSVLVSVSLIIVLAAGTSYALVVTGRDVQNGSLTTRDIRNGSLLEKDFAANQVAPSSILYQAKAPLSFFLTAIPEAQFAKVASLKLPAGAYLVQAEAVGAKRGGGTLIRCSLNRGSTRLDLTSVSVGETTGYSFLGQLAMNKGISGRNPMTIDLRCAKESTADPTSATYVESISLHAIRISKVRPPPS